MEMSIIKSIYDVSKFCQKQLLLKNVSKDHTGNHIFEYSCQV